MLGQELYTLQLLLKTPEVLYFIFLRSFCLMIFVDSEIHSLHQQETSYEQSGQAYLEAT